MLLISDNERVKLVATLAAGHYRGFVDDSIRWAADFVEAVEAELSRRVDARHATPPAPAKPRTVEDWMRENDREPAAISGVSFWWVSDDHAFPLGQEILPADIFSRLDPGTQLSTCSHRYTRRADAVADLRQALLSLQLIAE